MFMSVARNCLTLLKRNVIPSSVSFNSTYISRLSTQISSSITSSAISFSALKLTCNQSLIGAMPKYGLHLTAQNADMGVAEKILWERHLVTIRKTRHWGTRIRGERRANAIGTPQVRGVILKMVYKKPRKPNAGNRRCCKVRLTNNDVIFAFVPGQGAGNLQEHSQVLIEGGRLRDFPSVRARVLRGRLDCAPVPEKQKIPKYVAQQDKWIADGKIPDPKANN